MNYSIILVCLLFSFSLTSCKKSADVQSQVKQSCLKKVRKYLAKNPAERLEQKFFTDSRSRGLLQVDRLKEGYYREESASATVSRHHIMFQFQDEQGTPVVLANSTETGGSRLQGSNRVSYEFHCKTTWNLFKDRVTKEKLFLKEHDLEVWSKKMKVEVAGTTDTDKVIELK